MPQLKNILTPLTDWVATSGKGQKRLVVQATTHCWAFGVERSGLGAVYEAHFYGSMKSLLPALVMYYDNEDILTTYGESPRSMITAITVTVMDRLAALKRDDDALRLRKLVMNALWEAKDTPHVIGTLMDDLGASFFQHDDPFNILANELPSVEADTV